MVNISIDESQCQYVLRKPGRWIDECEPRMDLSLLLGISRKISFTVSSSGSELFRGIAINMGPWGISAPHDPDERGHGV